MPANSPALPYRSHRRGRRASPLLLAILLCLMPRRLWAASKSGEPAPGKQRRATYPHREKKQSTLLSCPSWLQSQFGLKQPLAKRGIVIKGLLTGDFSKNFTGGLRTNLYSARYLLDINTTFDLQKLAGWRGGKIFLDYQNHSGTNAQVQQVGNVQGISNVDAYSANLLARAWFQQSLAHKRLRFRVGSMFVDDQFLYPDFGQAFLNPAMGYDPSVFVLPTYPRGEPGADVFVYPDKHVYAAAGIFDGHLHQVLPRDPGGIFFIGEAGLRYDLWNLPGRLKLGLWNHTGTFPRFRGGDAHDAHGWYFVATQKIFQPGKKKSRRGLGLFFQYGSTQRSVSLVTRHIGAGFSWVGPIPGRPSDELGMGLTYVRLSPEAALPHPFEWNAEAFYAVQLSPCLTVEPDLQYIRHPGGNLPDAVVGTLRLLLRF